MMFRNLLFAAMALVVLAFGMEPDTYDAPRKSAQHAAVHPAGQVGQVSTPAVLWIG
jgi:hypothetical protein